MSPQPTTSEQKTMQGETKEDKRRQENGSQVSALDAVHIALPAKVVVLFYSFGLFLFHSTSVCFLFLIPTQRAIPENSLLL